MLIMASVQFGKVPVAGSESADGFDMFAPRVESDGHMVVDVSDNEDPQGELNVAEDFKMDVKDERGRRFHAARRAIFFDVTGWGGGGGGEGGFAFPTSCA